MELDEIFQQYIANEVVYVHKRFYTIVRVSYCDGSYSHLPLLYCTRITNNRFCLFKLSHTFMENKVMYDGYIDAY